LHKVSEVTKSSSTTSKQKFFTRKGFSALNQTDKLSLFLRREPARCTLRGQSKTGYRTRSSSKCTGNLTDVGRRQQAALAGI
jgi:hypothetical protein